MMKGGYVYLLSNSKEKEYKIGVTKSDIDKRIKKLQTGSAEPIYLIRFYYSEHPFLLERWLHQQYFSKRMEGEWFYLEDNEVSEFEQHCLDFEKMSESLKNNIFWKKQLNH